MTGEKLRIGIDIGRTFIDFNVLESDGSLEILKSSLEPDYPLQSLINGMEALIERKCLNPSKIGYVSHGISIGTQILAQRSGANMCLFVTEGFGDMLEIQRLRLPNKFDLYSGRPAALISRDRVIEVKERIAPNGAIVIPLDENIVADSIVSASRAGIDGIVICLLNAYKNPAHEATIKKIVTKKAPNLFVFCSSELLPVIREYERAITCVLNGYFHPKIKNYMEELKRILMRFQINVTPRIGKSNGGLMTADRANKFCVETLVAGPAMGVVGAVHAAKFAGIKDVLTLDIGGAEANISAVPGGEIHYAKETNIEGFPLVIPHVKFSTSLIGGNSIIRMDVNGMLKVGPESAGARPGPACYNLGGTEVTITDALLICGLLDANSFSCDRMKLDVSLAENAILKLARELNLSLEETANASLELALNVLYTQFGRTISMEEVDCKDFTLVTYGGLGPLLGPIIADEFEIRRILIPVAAGTMNAFGSIISGLKNDFVLTVLLKLNESAMNELKASFDVLQERAVKWQEEEGVPPEKSVYQFWMGMRHIGQSSEIEVPVDKNWILTHRIKDIVEAFHKLHRHVYGYANEVFPIEVLTLRLTIQEKTDEVYLQKIAKGTGNPIPASVREVTFRRCRGMTRTYRTEDLLSGQALTGPALVSARDCSILIADGFTAAVDLYGNILMEKDGEKSWRR